MSPSFDSGSILASSSTPAPPGYSSLRGGISPTPSALSQESTGTEELVSADSQPNPITQPIHAIPYRPPRARTESGHETRLARQRHRRHQSLPHRGSVIYPQEHRRAASTTHMPIPPSGAAPETPPIPMHFREKLTPQSVTSPNQTNFVSLSRKTTPHKGFFTFGRASSSITGTFTVNPYLHVPAALLAPLPYQYGSDRKNLKLEVENGGIDVNILLIGDPQFSDIVTATRTTLDLRLHGGKRNTFPLVAKIQTPSILRPPFHLTAVGVDGYVSLYLPESFHGLVSIKVRAGDLNAHISLSPQFAACGMILSETTLTRSYFVGELGRWAKTQQGWEGDRVDLVLDSGKVRLQILGEKGWDKLRRLTWKLGV
ncbi:hypothetical protein BD779DRAFT_1471026 [Infundibulicybe gibba]|nr:hypothetical protein BD779DRAFT_1471026 [Infundibulicybe gibba]